MILLTTVIFKIKLWMIVSLQQQEQVPPATNRNYTGENQTTTTNVSYTCCGNGDSSTCSSLLLI